MTTPVQQKVRNKKRTPQQILDLVRSGDWIQPGYWPRNSPWRCAPPKVRPGGIPAMKTGGSTRPPFTAIFGGLTGIRSSRGSSEAGGLQ
jgi:hypothetical protein